MQRLSLSVQLAIILALAMITSLLAVIVVDRINEISRAKNDYFGSADGMAFTLLNLHAELSENDFRLAVTMASDPHLWVQYGPWEGLHAMDARDRDREVVLLEKSPIPEAATAARVGSRTYKYVPKVRGNPEEIARNTPRLFALGNQPKQTIKLPPKDGKPYGWVLAPEDPSKQELSPQRKEGWSPLALGNRPTTVYTVALQPAGDDNWIVVYRLVRPAPLGGTLSIAAYAVLAGLGVSGLALLVGSRVMTPFRQVAHQAERLGRGERAAEVQVAGARDVREIVSAFNKMNARVSQATDYQIGLLRSLGHDLKGPLAAISRLVSDVGPNATRVQIEARLHSVQSIVEDIMSFSRAVMRDGELEVTDMASMLDTVIDEQVELGANAIADTPDRLLLKCRANAMQRCLRNLVENAIKYGGSVRATLAQDGEEAVVQIDDDGPGIPEDEIESAFQPFYRLAHDERGSGLGLAIARTIVIDQGGTLSLSNRPEGGLRAELKLPL